MRIFRPYIIGAPEAAGADYTETAVISSVGTIAVADTYSADYPESVTLTATGTVAVADTYSASSAPILSALTATAITGNSVTPQVTVTY